MDLRRRRQIEAMDFCRRRQIKAVEVDLGIDDDDDLMVLVLIRS